MAKSFSLTEYTTETRHMNICIVKWPLKNNFLLSNCIEYRDIQN